MGVRFSALLAVSAVIYKTVADASLGEYVLGITGVSLQFSAQVVDVQA